MFGIAAITILLSAAPSHAVSGTWLGTSNVIWSGPSNWSSSPSVPGASDTATFNGNGNGHTALLVDG